jgi:hypothetical protein
MTPILLNKLSEIAAELDPLRAHFVKQSHVSIQRYFFEMVSTSGAFALGFHTIHQHSQIPPFDRLEVRVFEGVLTGITEFPMCSWYSEGSILQC